jgi:hypothetical protein
MDNGSKAGGLEIGAKECKDGNMKFGDKKQ